MSLIGSNSRITILTKHTSNTSKVLEALIEGLTEVKLENKKKFAILLDNGSEFKKDFQFLVKEKELVQCFTLRKTINILLYLS